MKVVLLLDAHKIHIYTHTYKHIQMYVNYWKCIAVIANAPEKVAYFGFLNPIFYLYASYALPVPIDAQIYERKILELPNNFQQ